MSMKCNLERIRENVWELPSSYKKDMRVPGRLYLDEEGIKYFCGRHQKIIGIY